MDDQLTRYCKILEALTTSCRELNETLLGITGILELVLERLNTIERRPIPIPDLDCDETKFSVCNIACECDICIESDATSPESVGRCVLSIDCECNICIESDATSPRSEGLHWDGIEINRPSEFHILDDQQLRVELLNVATWNSNVGSDMLETVFLRRIGIGMLKLTIAI
ncbi:hypothetical protein HAX54_020690 [Datura stramonium]|uniref:Uncharacterized protein n=1 Tax=Datura stramonium TaxID=4076 RepID=A0ABS8UTJ9_DATST|nr:hypothetical protein [Datura stramonium]